MDEHGTERARKRIGTVKDVGGGMVRVYVDRDLDTYPDLGAVVYVDAPAVCGAPGDGDGLPEGVEVGYVLKAGNPLPAGWQAINSGGAVSDGFDGPHRWADHDALVWRVPAPVPVQVPIGLALVGRQLPSGDTITEGRPS